MTEASKFEARIEVLEDALQKLGIVLSGTAEALAGLQQQSAASIYVASFAIAELRQQGILDGDALAEKTLAFLHKHLKEDPERDALVRNLIGGHAPPPPSSARFTLIDGGRADG